MSYPLDSKSMSIVIQVAHKNAAEIYSGTGDVQGYLAATGAILEVLLEDHNKFITGAGPAQIPAAQPPATIPGPPAGAVSPEQGYQNVVAAFPQATAVPQAPVTVPAGVGGKKGALVQDLIARPGEWYNNYGDPQAASGGGRGPDFKRKSDGEGIWVGGQYPLEPELKAALFRAGLLPAAAFPEGAPF